MSDFRIVKDRCPVTLSLISGETVAGAMFVRHSEDGDPRRETVRDVLNAPERFFPVEMGEGGTLLVAKDQVVDVLADVHDDGEELRHASARSARLDIALAGGFVRTGLVFLELPAEQPRLLDFLNRLTEHFLTLYASEGTRLVNCALIERVLPRD